MHPTPVAQAAPAAEHNTAIPYRNAGLARPTVWHETRPDGTLMLRAREAPIHVPGVGLASFVARWAQTRSEQAAFCERADPQTWRRITWREFHRQMLCVAAALLERGLSQQHPLMILSGNSIEQAVLVMAAEYVGIPTAPVSPAYALQSQAFTRLCGVHALVEPAAVFVQDVALFAPALQALGTPAHGVIAVHGATGDNTAWHMLAQTTLTPQRLAGVHAAHAAIDAANDIARIFFTSGSTGVPKGVPLSYSNVNAVAGQLLYTHSAEPDAPLVMLDWLPWNHAFGGLGNLGRVLARGGTLYIDDGRPLPAQFARTVHNLREVSPTLYASVPSAWALLTAELERDDGLARNFFARLRVAGYGGASLPRDVWQRFQAVAVRITGERIVFTSGFGATESSALGCNFNLPSDDVGNIGVPNPGVDTKLVPLEGGDGRFEIRMRGPSLFRGYLKRPDLSRAAFDDEGFYVLGDAVRLADPANPGAGLRYAGRCVEDFKLANGTWVRTGAVRVELLAQCSPLLTDAVICGHDRDTIAALAWPNVAACQRLAPELAQLAAPELVRHPLVVAALRERLRGRSGPPSEQVRRVLLMAEPPSADANEIADKGYINQATARERRAHLIAPLYAEPAGADVACEG